MSRLDLLATEMLCGKCNRALGLFDDDVERMQSAARYLEGRRS